MRTRSIALWTSVMILGSTPLGSTVHAGETDSVRFFVEFSDRAMDDPKATELSPKILDKLREHVGQTGEPSKEVDNRLLVTISDMPSSAGEDYLIRLTAIGNGEVVANSQTLACVDCGADELAAMAADMLLPRLEAIASAQPPPAAEPAQEPAQAEIEDVPAPVGPSSRKQRTLQIAGTTTAVTGALVLGAGGALLAVGKVFPRDTNGLVIDQIDYR